MDTLDSRESFEKLVHERDQLDMKYDGIIFPTLVSRIKALFVDLVVILMIFTTTTLFIDAFGDIHSFLKGFILIFMLYLYDPILTSFTGSTLGHKLMKLKVRRFNDPEEKISLGYAFLRFILKTTLGWISFLTVTSNKHKRAIHDVMSGSILLRDK
ncbi:MAG TPA: RDD family protein [Chryseolinea sp.]|nr:RDD family protein [Chryseolinea sp.]